MLLKKPAEFNTWFVFHENVSSLMVTVPFVYLKKKKNQSLNQTLRNRVKQELSFDPKQAEGGGAPPPLFFFVLELSILTLSPWN